MHATIKVLPPTGEDRALAVHVAGGCLVGLADGAGGTGNGTFAAELLMSCVTKLARAAATADWSAALRAFDHDLSTHRDGGQTTGILAFVDEATVRGASVGDSVAWLIPASGQIVDMTAHQRRRPLLGSGEALPVEFEARHQGGRILLASDGLAKYAEARRICAVVAQGTAPDTVDQLVELVRLPAGGFHDDVAVVIVSG